MVKLDKQEVKIVRELIRNPRISDNAISNKTGIPVTGILQAVYQAFITYITSLLAE